MYNAVNVTNRLIHLIRNIIECSFCINIVILHTHVHNQPEQNTISTVDSVIVAIFCMDTMLITSDNIIMPNPADPAILPIMLCDENDLTKPLPAIPRKISITIAVPVPIAMLPSIT